MLPEVDPIVAPQIQLYSEPLRAKPDQPRKANIV